MAVGRTRGNLRRVTRVTGVEGGLVAGRRHGLGRAVCGAVALVLVLLAGCGSQDGPLPNQSDEAALAAAASPSPAVDRLELLRTCPADAPSWFDEFHSPVPEGLAGELAQRRQHALRDDEAYVRHLHGLYDVALAADPAVAEGNADWSRLDSWGFLVTADEEHLIWKRQEDVQPAVNAARRYLSALPDDQAGELRVDSAHGAVVVQVTRDAEQVRAELQAEVGDSAGIVVETIRYSQTQLKRAVRAIEELDGIRLVSIGAGGANGRVDLEVRGDLDDVRRLVSNVAEACMVAITAAEPIVTVDGPSGLRGVEIPGSTCASVDPAADPSPPALPLVGKVQFFMVCGDGSSGGGLTVTSSAANFADVVVELSRPTQTVTGQVCAAYADLPVTILADTSGSTWLLEVPLDGCGHYRESFKDVRDRLTA